MISSETNRFWECRLRSLQLHQQSSLHSLGCYCLISSKATDVQMLLNETLIIKCSQKIINGEIIY